jgi:hypothetical protein
MIVKGSDDQKQALGMRRVVTRKVCGQLQCDERNEELREESRLISSDKRGQADLLVGLILYKLKIWYTKFINLVASREGR